MEKTGDVVINIERPNPARLVTDPKSFPASALLQSQVFNSAMALPPSTANWHWKNKNITKWGEEWMKRELTTISVTGSKGEVASILSVDEVDGDVELGQRKSKYVIPA